MSDTAQSYLDPFSDNSRAIQRDMPFSPANTGAAITQGDFSNPFSSEGNSWDTLAGGQSEAQNPTNRTIGRTIGSYFAGNALAGAAAGGSGEVEGAGMSGAGSAGGGSDGAVFSTGETTTGGAASAGTAGGLAGAGASTGTDVSGLSADTGQDPNSQASGGGQVPAMLSADVSAPTFNLSPEVASNLGITSDFGGSGFAGDTANTGAVSGGDMSGLGGSNGMDMYGGQGEGSIQQPSGGYDPATGQPTPSLTQPNKPTPDKPFKILGMNPATAALLGISGLQAFSKPKMPDAQNKLSQSSIAGADQANAVIQSGGQSSPAWASQKSSIDATIDQQIKDQTSAMLQQAQNSGQGADSQVTQQQINKIKTQLETQRQTLYAQAQQQNVQAALQQLGISDQALAQVSNAQFASSNQAKQSAAQTAGLALQLQALSGGGKATNNAGVAQ